MKITIFPYQDSLPAAGRPIETFWNDTFLFCHSRGFYQMHAFGISGNLNMVNKEIEISPPPNILKLSDNVALDEFNIMLNHIHIVADNRTCRGDS